jgi:hypothetical protein
MKADDNGGCNTQLFGLNPNQALATFQSIRSLNNHFAVSNSGKFSNTVLQ